MHFKPDSWNPEVSTKRSVLASSKGRPSVRRRGLRHVDPESYSLLTSLERELSQVEPFNSLPVKLDARGLELAHIGAYLKSHTDLASNMWGKAFNRWLGLDYFFFSELHLYEMMDAVSSLRDMLAGNDTSAYTWYWRSLLIGRMRTILDDPILIRKYLPDVLATIIGNIRFHLSYSPPDESRALVSPHTRGLQHFVDTWGGYEHVGIPPQMEAYIALSLIPANILTASYLDDVVPDAAGKRLIANWLAEVDWAIDVLKRISNNAHRLKCEHLHPGPIETLEGLFSQDVTPITDPHRLFILLYLGWLRGTESSEYTNALNQWLGPLEIELLSIECCSHQDYSWGIIHSGCGGRYLKWKIHRMMKVLYRTNAFTRQTLRYWLYALVTNKGELVPLAEQFLESVRDEALSGLPIGDGDDEWKEGAGEERREG